MSAAGIIFCGCGCEGEPGETCVCGCPCGTSGGITSCDGRKSYPPTGTITFDFEPITWQSAIDGTGGNAVALTAANISNVASGANTGIIAKLTHTFTVTGGSSYTINDPQSTTCSTTHGGYKSKWKATNGDTYAFDAMSTLPHITFTRTLDDLIESPINTSTSGSGTVTARFQDWTLDQTDDLGWTYSYFTLDYNGSPIVQMARFLPTDLVFGNAPASGGTVINPNGNVRFSWHTDTTPTSGPATSLHAVRRTITPYIPKGSASGQLLEQLNESVGYASGATALCLAGSSSSLQSPITEANNLSALPRTTSPQGYAYSASYVYNLGGTQPTLLTDLSEVSSVNVPTDPGGESCARCYRVEITETDAETSAVTTLLDEVFYQASGGLLEVGEDPLESTVWPYGAIWLGSGAATGLSLGRGGPTWWTIAAPGGVTPIPGPGWYNLIGTTGCPDSITDIEARVEEVQDLSSDNEVGSKLLIHTRSITITEVECPECVDYACDEPCPPPEEGMMMMAAMSSPAPTAKKSKPDRPAAIPRDKWGEGLNEWIAQRTDADKGVGSTLNRIGTAEAKAILIQITHGTRCKCVDRVATADSLYPY